MKAKKIRNPFIGFFLLCSSSLAFAQSWDWGAAGYGVAGLKPELYSSCVASDISGNAYVTGYYSGGVLFGSDTLLNAGAYSAFLAKYDQNGNLLWATQPIDSADGSCFGYSVTTDASGNSIITGAFTGGITFGNYPLSTEYYYYTFYIAKYDPNGNVLWAEQAGSSIGNYYMQTAGYSVTTDKNNNIYVGGVFSDTLRIGNYILTTSAQSSPFLVKYDANGNIVWTETPTSPSNKSTTSTVSVTADSKGNVYLTGGFTDAFVFSSYHLISLNVSSAFLVKYSGGGNVLWAKQSDNETLLTSTASAASVITDQFNNVYVTGSFQDSVKFGSIILRTPVYYYYYTNYNTAFLTKYDTNGNVIWAKQSSYGLSGNSLAKDEAGSIYLGTTNSLTDTAFSFGHFTLHILPWADNSSFLWKFDTAGTAICGSALQNAGYQNAVSICCSSSSTMEYIYMTGTFISGDTVTCGPNVLFSNMSGYTNIYLSRWLNCAADAGVPDLKNASEVNIYPNPSNGQFTIAISHPDLASGETGSQTIEVYNMLGEKVYSQSNIPIAIGKNPTFNINLSSQPNGVYLYRVITSAGSLMGDGKLVIER